jgi:hypothetical protein
MLEFLGGGGWDAVRRVNAGRKFWLFRLACALRSRDRLTAGQWQAVRAAEATPDADYAGEDAGDEIAKPSVLLMACIRTPTEGGEQARLLREVLGNPFRPVTPDPAWLTPDVLSLAQAAYEHRKLPRGTLEPDRLALLADALEDAGCDSADLRGHLRGPGPHVRGCWAVDLVLGRQ